MLYPEDRWGHKIKMGLELVLGKVVWNKRREREHDKVCEKEMQMLV